MQVPPKLKQTANILQLFKKSGRAVDPYLSNELQIVPTTFENQGTSTPIWQSEEPLNKITTSSGSEIRFSSFIDGVQRASVVYWVALEETGALVPIVLSHIAAGITLRNQEKRLVIDSALIKDKLLLLLPLTGMEKSGFEGNEIRDLIDKDEIIDEKSISSNSLNVFGMNGIANDKLILCDTTFTNVDRKEEDEKKALESALNADENNQARKKILIGDNLLNSYVIRQRALGRVNTIRQILEMMVLTKFREIYPSDSNYILVDGPLFFLAKWIKNYGRFKGQRDDKIESFVLRNAVGMVKTLKSRPAKNATLKSILNLEENDYSELMSISDAVDVTGDDYTGEGYLHPHITAFYRFRFPKEMQRPSPLGLTRVDLHVSTFGANTFEEVKTDKTGTKTRMDNIIAGISREKWPAISQKGRVYNEVFPIGETERMLRSRLYSFVEMNYIYSYVR